MAYTKIKKLGSTYYAISSHANLKLIRSCVH